MKRPKVERRKSTKIEREWWRQMAAQAMAAQESQWRRAGRATVARMLNLLRQS